MMAPMPAENPATTVAGTLDAYLPSRSTQNAIMSTEATIDTFAAPPIPCDLTASAMNGTVALAVPPISTGLRPNSAVTGAVQMDVTTPRIGGRPISAAMESPYGSAMSAAISPPAQSPQNRSQLYLPVARSIPSDTQATYR